MLEEEGFEVLPIARVVATMRQTRVAEGSLFVFNLLLSLMSNRQPASEDLPLSIDRFLKGRDPSQGPSGVPRVIFIDQFEELFTAFPERWRDRRELFDQLGQALEVNRRLRLVLVIREDYLAELDPYAFLLPEELQTRFRLEPLREEAALEAVKSPLQKWEQHFEEGVAEQLVEDLLAIRDNSGNSVKGEFVEPMQLQVVCRNLWQNLKTTGANVVSKDDLARFGNVDQVLLELYDSAISEIVEEHGVKEGTARRWFERFLITPSRTRGAVYQGEHDVGGFPAPVLQDLERERLIVKVLRGGAHWYELAHDRMVEPILESNRIWLLARAGAEQMRGRLEEKVARWMEGGRRTEDLLEEKELGEAERWLTDSEAEEFGFDEKLRGYVQASRSMWTEVTYRRDVERAREIAEEQRLRTESQRLRVRVLGLAFVVMTLSLAVLGSLWYASVQRDRAKDSQSKATATRRFTSSQAAALNDQGAVLLEQGSQAEALTFTGKALNLARLSGDTRTEAAALSNLGKIYVKSGSLASAEVANREAIRLYQETGDRSGLTKALLQLGNVALAGDHPSEARTAFSEALSTARQSRDRASEANALYGLIQVNSSMQALIEAESKLQQVLESSERELREGPDRWLESPLASAIQAYSDADVDTLMRLHERMPSAGYAERALEVSERTRALGLIDVLVRNRGSRRPQTPQFKEQQRRLLSELFEKTGVLYRFQSEDVLALRSVEKETKALLAEYEAFRDMSFPVQFLEKPPSFRNIQGQLDKSSLLLEYRLGANRSYLWAVGEKSLATFILPGRRSIEKSVQEVLGLLSMRSKSSKAHLNVALAELSKMLLGPVVASLRPSRVLIVADGRLALLPFGALPDPQISEGGVSRPLIFTHEIVNLPSLWTVMILRQTDERKRVNRTIAVLADPLYSASDDRLPAAVRARGDGGSRFPETFRLPYTGREAMAIQSMSPDQSLVALGAYASRELVLSKDLSRFRILHFATDFWTNREPELNSIVLTQFDLEGKARDGFVRAYEVPTLDLSAELVVLSGSKTGTSGLSSSFMQIGVPRVIGSMWNVSDEATATFMEFFYRNLWKKGMTVPQAIQASQKEMAGIPKWNSPYYWAAFELQGDWR